MKIWVQTITEKGLLSNNQCLQTEKNWSKKQIHRLSPILYQDRLFKSSGGPIFAPTELQIKKFPIILDANDKVTRLNVEQTNNI